MHCVALSKTSLGRRQGIVSANRHSHKNLHKHTPTKPSMEGLSVLQAEVERLWEVREGWEKRIGRIQRRLENEEEQTRRVLARSAEEGMQRSEAAAEEQRLITKIRGKISSLDGRMRLLEERMDRVQEEGEREGLGQDLEREVMEVELERAMQRASRRVEMEQSMLEQLRRELAWMRGGNVRAGKEGE